MRTKRTFGSLSVFVLALLILGTLPGAALGAASGAGRGPVKSGSVAWEGPTSLPDFVGQAAEAQPLPAAGVPQNPFLGPNPFSHDHNSITESRVAVHGVPACL